ncbi:MAG: hypothetical protein VX938_03840 [Myxococcota bacterium]|nr:hypothetical protein [Myxococcota bacterium]
MITGLVSLGDVQYAGPMRRAHRIRAAVTTALALALLVGCVQDGTSDGSPDFSHVPAVDLVPVTSGKMDGSTFNPSNILDDWLFEDALLVTTEEIQAFLENSPYGTRSFLADHMVNGQSVAEVLVDAGETAGISPLVLLARMQVEQGLVFLVDTPSQSRLDKAMGCGCPDDAPCNMWEAGMHRQITCSANLMRSYLEAMDSTGVTVTGWGVGVSKESADGLIITPANQATAALYTYTPWTLEGTGGNWLFANVYTRYSQHLFGEYPNRHWIGGACTQPEECPFPGGRCMEDLDGGTCSAFCTGACPDVRSHPAAVTFCVDMEDELGGNPVGRCVSRCDESLYPGSEGCAPGFQCVTRERFQDPATSQDVCLPVP